VQLTAGATDNIGESVIDELRHILAQVQARAGSEFSGIGLVICNAPEVLPICSLRPASTYPNRADLVSQLTTISTMGGEYHDGFHVISTDWELLKVSQYFSPPIVAEAKINRTKRFGGRYLAALFGSALPLVSACGIASNGFGIAIFQRGSEVYYQARQ
jgi:hypothetical protein